MTDPNPPQEHNPPTEQSSGYAYPPPSEQQPPPGQYGEPYGAAPTTPGYQPQQPPGIQPQAGYQGQPPGAPAQPGPFSPLVGRPLTSDETMWSMLGHLGGIILGFIAPLIVMLTKGNESPYTRYHSVEALNFQIMIAIGWVVAFFLTFLFIGFLLYPVLIIGNIAFCIIAGLAANRGEAYRYPISIRLVK